MHAKERIFPIADSQDRLECKEIFGGIHDRDIEVSAGKIIASIYSAACCGGKGGDIYYIGVCKNDSISRVSIADVVGHGESVSKVSQYVYDALKSHMWDPDSRVILGEVNRMICSEDLDKMTTAAVVAYYSPEEKVRISYAGHPPIFYMRKADNKWSFAKLEKQKEAESDSPLNMPLAVDAAAHYDQFTITMASGDRLFIYTDGIIDAPNPLGERFGMKRLKKVLDENIEASLADLKSIVLKRLIQYVTHTPQHDDITLIALEVT